MFEGPGGPVTLAELFSGKRHAYTLLDMTALGRQEDWEEPKGRVAPVRGGDPTFTS